MVQDAGDNQVPLLENLYPECPGCRSAQRIAKQRGPPVKELCMISIVVICNAVPVSSLFPFMYFMVADFNIAKKREDIGYYAGAVGSIFMFGRFLSAMPWGLFADKYGRRPVFWIGLLSVIIFQMIFGTTNNFWVAIAARLGLGAFNGILGPVKAYASEVCSEANQPWGLSIVSTSWSLGLIIGPAMGGYLARPAVNFPTYFSENGFFGRYPYILPSVVQSAFAFVGLFAVFFMPETAHKHEMLDSFYTDEENWTKEKKTGGIFIKKLAIIGFYSCVLCVVFFGDIVFRGLLFVGGAFVFVVHMTVFPSVANYLGPILVTRVPAICSVPVLLVFTFVSHLSGTRQWLVLNGLTMIRNVLSTAVVTGTFMLTNNSVPTSQRGAANGLSLSCVSLFRTIGPAGSGAVFAWSQSRVDAKFLPGSEVLFVIFSILAIVAIFTTYPPILPKSTDRPYNVTHPDDIKSSA